MANSCDPTGCSPPGSSVHAISQERIVEWVAILLSMDLPNPRLVPFVPALQVDSLPTEPPGKPHIYIYTHTHTYMHSFLIPSSIRVYHRILTSSLCDAVGSCFLLSLYSTPSQDRAPSVPQTRGRQGLSRSTPQHPAVGALNAAITATKNGSLLPTPLRLQKTTTSKGRPLLKTPAGRLFKV